MSIEPPDAGSPRKNSHINDLPLPPVAQPDGPAYYLGTWSGRLILINTAVFLAMSYFSQTILLPTPDVLLAFGAKDPVLLAQGEFWRFFSPIFVHIGVIHFAFNSIGLYYIGYQLETILGPWWFLLIYLLAGTLGNIASAVFTVSISAGASGALFGLLGCGFIMERIIGKRIEQLTGRRPRQRIYASMVIANIMLGLMIPGIDNAAHLGGMATGMAITWAMLYLRPNRLNSPNKARGIMIFVFLLAIGSYGAYLGTSKDFLRARLLATAEKVDGPAEKVHYYTEALRLFPEDPELHFKRGRLYIIYGEEQRAFDDFRTAVTSAALRDDFEQLVDELKAAEKDREAWQLKRFIEHAGMRSL